MSYMRSGSCIMCGECCYGVARFMQVYDVDLPSRPKTGQWKCKFLKKNVNLFICEITKGLFSADKSGSVKVGTEYKRKRNGDLQEITQEIYDYWLLECQSFPDPLKLAHCPPKYVLPVSCGFTLVEA